MNEVHYFIPAHVVCQPAAEFCGEVELSVRESTGPAESAHGVTYFAVDTVVHIAGHDGAASFINVLSLLKNSDFQRGRLEGELVGCIDAGLPAANDCYIIKMFHRTLLYDAVSGILSVKDLLVKSMKGFADAIIKNCCFKCQ